MEAEYWVCGRGHRGLIESGTPPWEIACRDCDLVEMTQERDAARKSESEAAWLLERIVTYSDADDNLGDIHREARAYLARREEQS